MLKKFKHQNFLHYHFKTLIDLIMPHESVIKLL